MEKVYYLEKDGRKRDGECHNCEQCNNEFIRRCYKDNEWELRQKYCSKECSGISSRNRKFVECDWCHKWFDKPNSKVGEYNFCSRLCKENAQSIEGGFKEIQPNHYGNGEYVKYRVLAFKKYEPICSSCGWKDNIKLLDVHHIDENRKNNALDNLIILCPNCHASITRGVAKLVDRRIVFK